MQVNNSISMLTTQRAMSSAGKEMSEAMERLATGTKINNSADDPIGNSISQRMTAQIRALNTAVRNANDGIALTRSIEGAIGTLTDMLQRMRELAMQSSNGTNSNIDRSFLQEEVELLSQEITRVAETTRYNGALILDGRFKNQSFMVGTETSDEIKFSVDSVSSDMIGAHTYIGNGLEAMPSTTTVGDRNSVTVAHDVEITGYSGSALIEADLSDTAEITAKKINAATGQTGVKADARTIGVMSFAGTPSVKVTTGTANTYTAGTYYLQKSDGTRIQFVTSSPTAADFQEKIQAVTGDENFKVSEVDGGIDNDDELKFEGPSSFGDFDILGSGFTKLTGGSAAKEVVGADSARFRISVNGVATGNFVMNENFASEAVWAINQISGQTGVIATQRDHKIVLTDPNGGDITVENLSASKGLEMEKVGADGLSTIGGASSIGASGSNDSVRVSGAIKLSSAENFVVSQKGDTSKAAVKVTLGRADSYPAGDYYLKNSNGTRTEFTTVNSTAGEFQSKIRAATGDEGFTVVGVDGGFDNGLAFQITGPKAYGDFDLYKADGTKINGGAVAAVKISNEVAKSYGAGDYYIVDSDGKRTNFTTTAATTSNFQAGIRAATGDNGFTVVEVDGGSNHKQDDEMKITGSLAYGDFDLFKADGTRITGNKNASIKISMGTVDNYPAGDYYVLKANGTKINFTTTASSASQFQTKIRAATGQNNFFVFEADGSNNGNDEIIIRPPIDFDDFDIYKSDGSQVTHDRKILEVTGVPEEIKGISQPGYFAPPQDLYVQRDASPSTSYGKLSLVGDVLYEGDGSEAIVVGRVDSTKNGLNGEPFRINLELRPVYEQDVEFENGDFENGNVGDTTIAGWEIFNQQVRLNGNSTVAGHPTPDDTVFPATVDTGQAAPYDGIENAATYETKLSSETSTGSGKSVELKSTSVTVPEFGILHGPYLASQKSVKLQVGDKIEFDWRATGGSDAYDVMGYMVDEDTGQVEEILNQTGATGSASTSWSTVSAGATKAGNYKFVFVAGTWDASGGRAAGAKLYIDNVKVRTMPKLDAAQLQQLGQRLVTTKEGISQPFKAVIPNGSTVEFRVDDSGKSTLYQVSGVDVSNALDAGKSINIIDHALDKLSLMRSEMGAVETRLNQVITKQIGISEQATVSRSRLEDADYALEAARLSKTQVIQQAGASVLVQANEVTRMAIDLLKR